MDFVFIEIKTSVYTHCLLKAISVVILIFQLLLNSNNLNKSEYNSDGSGVIVITIY